MEAERIIELIHDLERHRADRDAHAVDRDGTNLLGLCLAVDPVVDVA